MKPYLKVIITILLSIAALMSIVSLLFSGLAIVGGLSASVLSAVSLFSDTKDSFVAIFGILAGIASALLFLVLVVLFLVIALACVVGIVYVFIGGNDKRIKELEAVINAAYSDKQESKDNSDEKSESDSVDKKAVDSKDDKNEDKKETDNASAQSTGANA